MIYLVRQGQTDWNLFRRCNGSTETFLNQTGIEQSELQAENLKDVKFNKTPIKSGELMTFEN